jgi:UDP-N-acetylmuramoylalanine--D-glutamate ligase
MKEAVEEALKNSENGSFILLSPAFASFGLFKNEYDRGDQFDEIVKSL